MITVNATGPWGFAATGTRFILLDGNHDPILRVDEGMVPVKANAYLIAAAPDLLEACKKAITCGLDSSVRQLIVAAIAKAEGRS